MRNFIAIKTWLLVVTFVCCSPSLGQTYSPQSESPRNASYESDGGEYSESSYAGYKGYPFYSDSSIGQDEYEYQATFPKVEEEEVFYPEYSETGEYRQPSAICFATPETALVSTRLSGNVYAFDWSTRDLKVAWTESGANWGEVIKIANGCVAVVESTNSEVQIWAEQDDSWQKLTSLPAPGEPNKLAWDKPSKTLLASGKWSQRLYRWQLMESPNSSLHFGSQWSSREELDLPMCGGEVLQLQQHDAILVMDAFGRNYAVVDPNTFEIRHQASVFGHNISGLAATADEDMVFFPHQLLNEIARSEKTDITWGGLMSNNIRWLKTDRILKESGDEIIRQGKFYPLGTPGNGAGDPSSMAVSSDHRIAVTLAGTNRVTIGRKNDYYFKQVDVGFRPVDCAYTPDESHLVVVNQFSDSLTLIDLESMEPEHVMLGELRPPTMVEQGEQLFFTSMLAHDRWMSCHSCHSQGHSNGQLNDNLSDKSFGTPKRVLSLLGQAQTQPYAWGGTIQSLEDQVQHSIISTMAGPEPDEKVVKAIAQYVATLPAAPSLLAARQELTDQQELVHQGSVLFKSQGCASCHQGKDFTSGDTYDVGIHDEEDMTHFNPPSLVGVSQRQNLLFHDGRATSLAEVLELKHQLATELDEQDAIALVQFLNSL